MELMNNATGDLADSSYYLLRFPTQALFECYFFLKRVFNMQDSFVALRIAEKFCNNNALLTINFDLDANAYSHYLIDITLGSCATALGALAQHPEDPNMHIAKDRYLELVRKLSDVIEQDQSGIHSLSVASPAPPKFSVIPFAAVNALVSITQSLVALTQAGYLGQNDDCPSRTLVDSLYRLCAGQDTLRECESTLRSAGLTGTQTETAAPTATTGGQPEAPVVQELDNGSGRAYGDGFASARDLEEGKSVSIGDDKDDGSG
ncbi:hypothetical protein NM688_g7440 [Phlebia brevispora]|uniref:Uncharacterized protein n=1 Tax=Phlebia brevispora TaxID=194682 RepID=A0ACC1S5F2_9APHY|nr:hypothetical protein NM688_g7440 [Phlebia brevispora]